MDAADLLSNAGGYGLTEEEKKRALKYGLLNMGVGILANNYGNYGAFAPAIGRGAQQGLLGYQAQIGREEQGAQQRNQRAAQQKLFQDSQQGGQFDKQRFLNSAMQNPDAGLYDMAAKAMLSNGQVGDPTSQIKNYEYLNKLPEGPEKDAFRAALSNSNAGSVPADIQVFEYMKKLPQQDKDAMFAYKRAAQVINRGGSMDVLDPYTKDIAKSFPVTPKVTDTPAYQAAQETAKGEAQTQVSRAKDAPKVMSMITSQEEKQKILDQTIDKAVKNSGFWTTGVMAQMLSGVGGTSAKNMAATLNTIKANIGFDALQEMRNNSPTGGALGQVAVQEIEYLQSVIASLDQSQDNEQLKENLMIVKKAKKESNARIRKAYEETYGTGKPSANKPSIDSLW